MANPKRRRQPVGTWTEDDVLAYAGGGHVQVDDDGNVIFEDPDPPTVDLLPTPDKTIPDDKSVK